MPPASQQSTPSAQKKGHVKLANEDFVIGHGTHAGRSGKGNEDDYAIFDARQGVHNSDPPVVFPARIALVADGVGGSSSGEIASKIAIKAFATEFQGDQERAIQDRLENAIRTANREIFIQATENPAYKGMGTTIVAAAIVARRFLYIAHAGDSRAYLIRKGRIYLLTLDHTWAQEALDAGYLTAEQAKNHPNKNVIKRYLGPLDHVDVDHQIVDPTTSNGNTVEEKERQMASNNRIEFLADDTLLLCSDGLTDVVPDQDILATVTRFDPQRAVEQLIKAANNAGGPDNITVVILNKPGRHQTTPAAMASVTPLDAPPTMSPPDDSMALNSVAQVDTANSNNQLEDDPEESERALLPWIIGVMLLLFLIAGGYLVSSSGLLARLFPESTPVAGGAAQPTTSATEGEGAAGGNDENINDGVDEAQATQTAVEVAAITATVAFTLTQSAMPTMTETPIPTNTPTFTPEPTHTSTSTPVSPTATPSPTVTPLPTSVPTIIPTATLQVPPPDSPTPAPTVTNTPIPSDTPDLAATEDANAKRQQAIRETQAAAAVATATAAQPSPTPTPLSLDERPYVPQPDEVGIIGPDDGYVFGTTTDFAWRFNARSSREVRGVLAPTSDFYFEVIVFDETGDAKGMANAAKVTQQKVTIETLGSSDYTLHSGHSYEWTVQLVWCAGGPCNNDNYKPLGEVAPRREFVYKPGGSSGGGGGGDDCDDGRTSTGERC
ncbi:MAG: protein phosphatase 2C domain-containing protein [Chloroflexota bacterium]